MDDRNIVKINHWTSLRIKLRATFRQRGKVLPIGVENSIVDVVKEYIAKAASVRARDEETT